MFHEYFKSKKRDNGTRFYHLDDCAPEILRGFVHDVHVNVNDASPNDWIYQHLVDAFQDIERDGDNVDNIYLEADIYTVDLLEWAKVFYPLIDEANEEFGTPKTFIEQIQQANLFAKDRIYRMVHDFLQEHKNNDEEGEAAQ